MSESFNTPEPEIIRRSEYLSGKSDPEETGIVYQTQSAPWIQRELVWYMSSAEYLSFKTFFETTLNNGHKVFTATWLTDFDANAVFGRFAESVYQASLDGALWTITAKIEFIR